MGCIEYSGADFLIRRAEGAHEAADWKSAPLQTVSDPVILQVDLMSAELTNYRRRLPHWRLEGCVYFVTWRLHPAQPSLKAAERDLVKSTLLHFEKSRYLISAYVVMDDHIHLLVQPLEDWKLERLVQSWKHYSSSGMVKQYGRRLPVWQDEYMDRIIRNEQEFNEKANYILTNPARRWPKRCPSSTPGMLIL